MNRTIARRGLGVALAIGAVSVVAAVTTTMAGASAPAPVSAPTNCAAKVSPGTTRLGHFAGLVRAQKQGCNPLTGSNFSDPANGTPPLIFHNGPVMGTKSTGPLVITPIFWEPDGFALPAAYVNIVSTYFHDVALSSHRTDNTYAVDSEYFGTNGNIQLGYVAGAPITDTNPLPGSGCTVASTDTSGIYADGTGYTACLDDNQLQTEITRVIAAEGLPIDLAHNYVIFLPKHVESCFLPGSTLTAANNCTINYQPSATYCAYHSQMANGTVYSNLPFPVYSSATHFTCSTDSRFPTVQTPNGNADADTVVSPTMHEIQEAQTDPDTNTGWYDSSGFENGDECAYVYGQVRGVPGAFWNQTLGGHHYITQQEFSNRDFAATGLGCVQGQAGLITG